MQVPQCQDHFREVKLRLVFLEPAFLFQVIEEFSSGTEVQDQK